ncbi:MAG: M20/M25/M40 family metallo-hydrolase [Thermomicrobiales bacterium]
MFELVKELSELPGPTGHEDAVQDWVAERWGTFSREVRRTRVDNVLAKVGGSGPRLAIVAHADELSLLVKSISDEGFLHLWPYSDSLGRPPRWFMPIGQQALVVTSRGNVSGIFATATGHVIGGPGSKDLVEWNDWFIDLGVRSRKAVQDLGIRPGARVIWNPEARRIGENITGKAMDDRAAIAIATEVGAQLAGQDDLPFEVWLVSTVQEENGLLGASSLADDLQLDAAIALDVGLVGDIPGVDKLDFPSKLGGGPMIVYQDAMCHYSRRLSDALVEVAEENDIPVQLAVFQHFGSDGAALIKRGIDSALLAYPTRYTHSPFETVDENDLLNSVALLVAFVRRGPVSRYSDVQ